MELREFRAELPSTQSVAVARARAGGPDGTLIVAGTQSSGRGRDDRRWSSPVGNLYLSLVLSAPAHHRSWLPLAVGVHLRSELRQGFGVATEIKWPNDLLVVEERGTRKIAGLLLDLVDSPTLGSAAVVGVGVNVAAARSAYPPELLDRVVGISELTSRTVSLADVERLTVRSIRSAARQLDTPGGMESIRAECRAGLYGIGRPATVDSEYTGVIRGLGEDGALCMETSAGPVEVRAGSLLVEGR